MLQSEHKACFLPLEKESRYVYKMLNWDHSEKGKKPFHLFSLHDVRFFVAAEFANPLENAKQFCNLLQKAHPKLRANLRSVCMPFDYYGDETKEPTQEGSVPAGASLGGIGFIYLFGKQIFSDAKTHSISLLILEHELAHLASDYTDQREYYGGAPPHLTKKWQQAAYGDAQHQNKLPKLLVHQKKCKVSDGQFLSRSFGYGEIGFDSHVLSYQPEEQVFWHEDWCEAVSFYLLNQRQGYIWKEDGQTMNFLEYYPHRAKIIEQYLNSKNPDPKQHSAS